MASDDIGNCTIYSQRAVTIRKRFRKINNLQIFSFADYSLYMVLRYEFDIVVITPVQEQSPYNILLQVNVV